MTIWPKANDKWTEDQLQMYIVARSKALSHVFHGDQNKAKRSFRDGAKRKLLGMRAGWPDLCYLVPRWVYIELKKHKGRQSAEQVELQKVCNANNIPYYVVEAKNGPEAWAMVQRILASEI